MYSQTSLEVRSVWKTKEKSAKTSCPRLGVEVPDILLPDVGRPASCLRAPRRPTRTKFRGKFSFSQLELFALTLQPEKITHPGFFRIKITSQLQYSCITVILGN